MGTPFGRQDSKTWEAVQKWDKDTTHQMRYSIPNYIRGRFPHDNCSHDRPCEECLSLIEILVTATRIRYEEYLGHKLSELLNIKCPFPHGGD